MADPRTPPPTPIQPGSAAPDDAHIRAIAVKLSGQGGVTSEATWRIASLGTRTRLRRAGKTSAMLFGLAVASAPFPPIHWVLVPGFLIASVVAFFVRMGTGELMSGDVPCPKCHKSFALEPQPPSWPLELTCHLCHARLDAAPLS